MSETKCKPSLPTNSQHAPGWGVAVIQGGRDFSMAVPVFRLKRESSSQKTLAFIVAMLSFIDINFYVHV